MLLSIYPIMRPLSATECITPAIERTKLVLFKPFRTGRTWKLSATAYLCRIGTLFFPFPLVYLVFLPAARSAGGKLGAIVLVSACLAFTVLFVWIFALCSRLQFAFLDIVIQRGEFVAPAWRKYPNQSRTWTGLKILIGSAATLVIAVPLLAYIRHLAPLIEQMQSFKSGQSPPPQLFGAIFAGYGIILLVFGGLFLISSLASDFIVPSLALENTSLSEAFRRMIALISSEPGEFAIYTLLKVALAFALYTGAIIALEIVLLIAMVVLGIVAGIAGYLLHLVGVPSAVLSALAVLLWTIFSIVVIGYGMTLSMGPVFTFLEAFGLYFLGGRYPLLGDLLDRSTPPPALLYPNPYSPPPPPVLGSPA